MIWLVLVLAIWNFAMQGTMAAIRGRATFDVIDVLEAFLDQAEINGLRLWAIESGVEGLRVEQGSVH